MKKILFVLSVCLLALTAYTQNWRLQPHFGTVDLQSGFTPDPHVVNIVPGGSINLANAQSIIGMNVSGFVSDAPDLDLNYTSNHSYPLRFRVEGGSVDTLLLINDPSGTWHYNDDTHGLDPEILFLKPLSGMYNIWVGRYQSEGASGNVRLLISEL